MLLFYKFIKNVSFLKVKAKKVKSVNWFKYDFNLKGYKFSFNIKKRFQNPLKYFIKSSIYNKKIKFSYFNVNTFFKKSKSTFFLSVNNWFYLFFIDKLYFSFYLFSNKKKQKFNNLKNVTVSHFFQLLFKRNLFKIVFLRRFNNFYLSNLFNYYQFGVNIKLNCNKLFFCQFNSIFSYSFFLKNLFLIWKFYFLRKGYNNITQVSFYKFVCSIYNKTAKRYLSLGLKFRNLQFQHLFKRKWIPRCYDINSDLFYSFKKKFILFFRIRIKKFIKLQYYELASRLRFFFFKYACNVADFFFIPLSVFFKSAAIVSTFLVIRLQQNYKLNGLIRSTIKVLSKCRDLKGVVLKCAGRFSRKQRAQRLTIFSTRKKARPLGTFTSLIDYSFNISYLVNGSCGIKVWLLWQDPYLRSMYLFKRRTGKKLNKRLYKLLQFKDKVNFILQSWIWKKRVNFDKKYYSKRNKKFDNFFLYNKIKRSFKYSSKFYRHFISFQFIKSSVFKYNKLIHKLVKFSFIPQYNNKLWNKKFFNRINQYKAIKQKLFVGSKNKTKKKYLRFNKMFLYFTNSWEFKNEVQLFDALFWNKKKLRLNLYSISKRIRFSKKRFLNLLPC